MASSLLSIICNERPMEEMTTEKYNQAYLDQILPMHHKKVNPFYISSIHQQKEQHQLDILRDNYASKKYLIRQKTNELSYKLRILDKRKKEEALGLASLIEQTEKKIEKIQRRNQLYKELLDQMEPMSKSLEERVETLRQRNVQYSERLVAYKPCKDLIIEVTKLWPTVINEFELLQRLQTLITQKVRFTEEYHELYKLRESERKKLLYETAQDAEMNAIILSNKLDELEQEGKDIDEEIQKEEERFNRMMDTSSDVEAAVSEVRLGCLRLYNLTRPCVKTMDPFEQLTGVLEFGMFLHSVVEALEQPSKS